MAGAAFNLERFTAAQESTYPAALAELRAGAKHTHWMWFIFPQIAGLGHSPTAQYYALSGLDEARAYFRHPLLGRRILECTEAVNGISGRSALEIFGRPDHLKFRSSMTLFEAASPGEDAFIRALKLYFDGVKDPKTVEILSKD